jgi:ABC-type transporter Mla maintaining outer membrane lipid asymmetry ATPase subunit MlaF
MKDELQRGTAISIQGLTKRYPDNTVANRVIDLYVYEGEVLSILGPNGTGKTTLVRQITTELSKVFCLKCRRKAFRRQRWRPSSITYREFV